MIDTAVYNPYVIYSNTPNEEKLRIVNFRLSVAEDMLSTISLPNYANRGRPSQRNCSTRLQGKYCAHFPVHIPATDKTKHPEKRCIVCTKHCLYKYKKRNNLVVQKVLSIIAHSKEF